MAGADDEIRRLMARGLDLYALGQVGEATACWLQVLALDPDHPEARDYLQAADAEPAGPRAPAPEGVLAEAAALLRSGTLEEGLDLLETVAARDPANLEVHAFLEMARAALYQAYRTRVGSGVQVPRVRIAAPELMKFNLPATTGFLVSLIDGRLSLDELLAVSGMDAFEALRALAHLLDAGIVEARP